MTPARLVRRALLFALLWVVLVEGDPRYFAYAVLTVPVAVLASVFWLPAEAPRERLSVRSAFSRVIPLVALLGWLVGQSVKGGVDVARRSFARPVRIDPIEVVVPVRLTGGARAVALATVGLLPGTIVMEVGEHEALVHTLSADFDVEGTWGELERRVETLLSTP